MPVSAVLSVPLIDEDVPSRDGAAAGSHLHEAAVVSESLQQPLRGLVSDPPVGHNDADGCRLHADERSTGLLDVTLTPCRLMAWSSEENLSLRSLLACRKPASLFSCSVSYRKDEETAG
ncbi:hypothetical protein EYF80_041587 [Liparis tanakae]|uniref:Uncharacterized protein n=1 Tax=Liparis tanakae TaxID=230148 RepID=A0A4Z2G3T0_9TELE|nr:hypothetical protein EYF80_041587 [Liparis tanakae]